MREDEGEYRDCHLAKEEDEEAKRVELKQTSVFSEGAWKSCRVQFKDRQILSLLLTQTTTEADDENNCASKQQNYGNVQENVIICVDFYQSSGLELVEEGIETNANEKTTKQPEDEIQQKYQILCAGADVCEVVVHISVWRRHLLFSLKLYNLE